MDTKLYTLFAPNFIDEAVVRKYKRGGFSLSPGLVGMVLEGVVAVDKSHRDAEESVSTLRLASFGDLINIEQIFKEDGSDENLQYVSETSQTVLALLNAAHFKHKLSGSSVEVQNTVSQELLSQFIKINNDIGQSLVGSNRATASVRVLWALRRFQKASNTVGSMQLTRERLAIHTGLSLRTISRTLRQLQADKVITCHSRTDLIINED